MNNKETEYKNNILKHQHQINKMALQLTKQETENQELTKKIEKERKEKEHYMQVAQSHKSSIRYRVGSALFEAKNSFKKFVKLPYLIYTLYKESKTLVPLSNLPIVTPEKSSVRIVHSFDFSTIKKDYISNFESKISIIIPIYNAFDDVVKCIKSVLKKTDFPYQLILIDDCSTDERISSFLKTLENTDNVLVVKNDENLGYVGSVNKGIALAKNDVVLLNSDTIVTKRWLSKLVLAAYSDTKNMTVTPFSNAAGAFSVPVMGRNDNIPENFTLEKMSKLVEHESKLSFVNVPTGNGFCLYIKREAFNLVGLFDVETFGKGYGEENDFCMKLQEKGYKNIIADDVYIYHKRSASFGNEKKDLMEKNLQTLKERYPSYSLETQVFSSDSDLIENRRRISNALTSTKWENTTPKRILYVMHEGGGGTVLTNQDLMKFVHENSHFHCFLLTSNGQQMKLFEVSDESVHLLQQWNLNHPWDINLFYSEEYENIYYNVLRGLHIDLVHIRHLFKHSLDIIPLCKTINIPVVLSFHDFYFVCPTVNLINSDGVYCEGKCREKDEICRINSPMIKMGTPHNQWVQNIWRKEIKKLLGDCSSFVTTSEYTKEILLQIYPEIVDRFYIIEHGRDFSYSRSFLGKQPKKSKIRILIAGNIDYNKGEEYISKLIAADKGKRLEFHAIGNISEFLKGSVHYHGEYRRSDFQKLVKEIAPSYIGIFSIWPETYCHVLTEAWSCGVPCIVSDVGTLHERGLHNGCILADLTSAESTVREILRVSDSLILYNQLVEEVQNATIKSVFHMGFKYIELYTLMTTSKIDNIIYFLDNYETNKPPPSTYIRIISPVLHNEEILDFSVCTTIRDLTIPDYKPLLAKKQFILVQRDRITKENLRLLKKLDKVKIIVEIDDDLLNIPDNHPEKAYYQENQKILKELVAASTSVITTSNNILTSFDNIPSSKKIPNFMDERLWMKEQRTVTIAENTIKILYFGSISHLSDLKIVGKVAEQVKNTVYENAKRKVEFYIIGGCDEHQEWATHIEIPDTKKEFPHFVDWLLSTVTDFHIGVAPLDLNHSLNYSKSYLKYLEYSALCLAGVFTDIQPYQEVIQSGVNGMLISDNNENKWAESLVSLCCDDRLRETIAKKAYDDIIDNHLLKNNYSEWADLFR